MPELDWLAWLLVAVAALLVGFAKTAIGGVGTISVALFATVLPAKASTGALLPLLLVGDVVAVRAYRAHADWRALLRLMPAVLVGVVAGFFFIDQVDDTVMRRTIGVVLIGLVAVHLWSRRRTHAVGAAAGTAVPERPGPVTDGAPAAAARQPDRHRARTRTYGVLAGFTTMVANAGGAAMTIYLLSKRMTKLGFLGTTAWFFLVVNAVKVPFSLQLDLISPTSLLLDSVLVPAVLAGATLGRFAIARIDQGRFETLVLFFTVVSSLNLLL